MLGKVVVGLVQCIHLIVLQVNPPALAINDTVLANANRIEIIIHEYRYLLIKINWRDKWWGCPVDVRNIRCFVVKVHIGEMEATVAVLGLYQQKMLLKSEKKYKRKEERKVYHLKGRKNLMKTNNSVDWESIVKKLEANQVELKETVQQEIDIIPTEALYARESIQEFSKKIRQLRKERKITQTEVANILGISRTEISKLERGNSNQKEVGRKRLQAFALLFKVRPHHFLPEKVWENDISENSKASVLKCPLLFVEKDTDDAALLIVSYLKYIGPKSEEYDPRLEKIYDKMCDIRSDTLFDSISVCLNNIPVIRRALETELDVDKETNRDELNRIRKYSKDKGLNKFHRRICDLGERRYDILKIMAHIAQADEQVKRVAAIVLDEGGFFENKKAMKRVTGFWATPSDGNGLKWLK